MNQSRTQDVRAVAYRALSLGALLQRAEFEIAVQELDSLLPFDQTRDKLITNHTRNNDRLLQWIQSEYIEPHLTTTERFLLHQPIGTWADQTLVNVGWRVEALGVMLWALNRLDTLAAYDTRYDMDMVLLPLDIGTPVIDFIWCATLRDPAELIHARDTAELWNWRSRARELERMGVKPPDGVTFREIVLFTAERAYEQKKLPYLIDGDFPAFNRPYASLTHDEYDTMRAIAYERYGALNWVCELSSDWEGIRVSS